MMVKNFGRFAIPAYAWLTADLSKQAAKHNAKVDKAVQDWANYEADYQAAMSPNPLDFDAKKIEKLKGYLTDSLLGCVRDSVAVVDNLGPLVEQMQGVAREEFSKAQHEFDTTLSSEIERIIRDDYQKTPETFDPSLLPRAEGRARGCAKCQSISEKIQELQAAPNHLSQIVGQASLARSEILGIGAKAIASELRR